MSREIQLTQGHVAIVDDDDYEELNKFKWQVTRDRSGTFYARRTTSRVSGNQRTVRMSRQILGAMTGEHVDHRNHDTLDNRRANIRLCTPSQNHGNRRKRSGASSSRYKGVYWHRATEKWHARITHRGRVHSLGYHDDELDAAHAYNVAAAEHFGEFALLNEV